MDPQIQHNLDQLNLSLPKVSAPNYAYHAVEITGKLGYVAGQIPKIDGELQYRGPVQEEDDLSTAVEAAQVAAANILAQIEASIGLERLDKILKINVYVASSPGFYRQPIVADGASNFLRNALGEERAGHARTALAVPQLPQNATVEIDAVFSIKHD